MTTYRFQSKPVNLNFSGDFPEPAEPAPMDAELAEKARQRKEQEEDELLAVMVRQAAAVIAGDRLDVATTIEGALTTVLAANKAGNDAQWIVAMKCLSDVLTAVTERENRLLNIALAWHEEKRLSRARKSPATHTTLNRR